MLLVALEGSVVRLVEEVDGVLVDRVTGDPVDAGRVVLVGVEPGDPVAA